MSFANMKTFTLLQLLLLLLSSFNGGDTNAQSPVPSPTPEPSQSPVHSSSKHPPSKPVYIQGLVYCKSCNCWGLENAKPISGAIVKLRCHNTRHVKNVMATTNDGGYFYLEAPHTVATYGVWKCRVFLFSSPSSSPCQMKTDINNGTTGGTLRYEPESDNSPRALYSVGPFAFESKC